MLYDFNIEKELLCKVLMWYLLVIVCCYSMVSWEIQKALGWSEVVKHNFPQVVIVSLYIQKPQIETTVNCFGNICQLYIPKGVCEIINHESHEINIVTNDLSSLQENKFPYQ